ncbi:nitroreductase family protein [Tautonia sociabilis]|uniref:Nitroreductase n=1 Tax=Tautonia sociabilis TaxID=2080755 RepID=A0A432MH70_9BACT|nr:nitroreductase family protein [Tautonia sociabilis]RUL86444.1 nitroreductase [Tautonia sociabilis]
MTAAEAILRRRSSPRFDPDLPVTGEELVRLLGLARHSPSQHNLQPWRFLVVRDRANRDRLRRWAFGHPALADAPVALLLLGYLYPHRSHWDAILKQMRMQAYIDSEAVFRRDAEVRRDLAAEPDLGCWACKNAMLAAATLMIAAEGLGLASCPIDRFDPGPIRDDFGIPADHALCALIALGHPALPDEVPSLGRLPLAELCFEEHFGRPWTLGEPDLAEDQRPED